MNARLISPILIGLLAWSPVLSASGAIDFNRQIRPILSDACYHCHGPDQATRKAKLRLDLKEGAFDPNRSQPIIVPGQPEQSALIRRITSSDPDELMPPPDSHRKLSPEQIATLKQWVAEGGKWEEHWAFRSITQAVPPQVGNSAWIRNGIDRFILARLEQEGLAPAPESTKERLLRRVSFDLTGIGPTTEELDAFLNDSAPDAYEKALERLLSSQRYGERMAADWLDLARFADTHGFQADRYRPMWQYRDWVIQAFNQNLSFDQFTIWQLAGDLLPNATKEQRLATAFNRLHLQNEEGGIVEEEYRVSYVVDRVNTFGTAFLGLTLDCSRCHDHKYDPISMQDYYSLFSFFQNIDESGQTTHFTDAMPVPTLILSDEATDQRLTSLREKIAAKELELPSLLAQAREQFGNWLTNRGSLDVERFPGTVAVFDFDELQENKLPNRANEKSFANLVDGPAFIEGRSGKAAELNGENGFSFPGLGHFNRTDPFTLSIWVQTPAHAERAVIIHHSKAPIDAGSRGYELLLENGAVAFGLHHMWPGNSLKVRTSDRIATNRWVHLAATYDGSSKAKGVVIYIDGHPAPVEVLRDRLYKDITYGGSEPDLAIGYRFRDSGFKEGRVDDFAVFDRALAPIELLHLSGKADLQATWSTPADQLSDLHREQLFGWYSLNAFPDGLRWLAELRELRREENSIIQPIPEVMVMEELPEPKPAFVLKRGAYDAPGDPVQTDTPKVLPPFPEDQSRNRLGLARWLVSPQNPLMARVTVNRAWQQMFGKGLVETSDNFGSQGSPPSHPELLDWLAQHFIDSGWDMKGLLKLLATSATYRQSSQTDSLVSNRDPGNQLLARAPARRLTAEMLRDHSLAVSGLLVEKIGGPSVKPYQPEGLWEQIAMGRPQYQVGKGEDLYRRTLYTFWKRTVPHPAMVTFDSADRNVCSVQRQSTSTPLQALALLNDPQHVEAARLLAERMLLHPGGDIKGQTAWAFRLATGRHPTSKESLLLYELYLEQRSLFEAHKDAAAKLLKVGDRPSNPDLPATELAAATVLAQAILNHDESVYRR